MTGCLSLRFRRLFEDSRLVRAAPLLSGCLSGLLFWASIPKADLWPLAWFFLLPCLFWTPYLPRRTLFWTGMVAGFVAGIGRTYWITQTLQLYGNLSFLEALSTNLLLILYLALYWGLFFILCADLRCSSPLFPWIAASIWILGEWAQNWVFTGFPWELVGYSQYRNLPVFQLASITGIYGVSFLVVLINGALSQLLFLHSSLSRRLLMAAPPLLLLVIVWVWGQQRYATLEAETGEVLQVGIVQGNIPQDQKWRTGRVAGATQHYVELTRILPAQQLDLIVFPETALPFYYTHPHFADYQKQIAELAHGLDTPLLVGSLGGSWEEGIYNRAYLLDRHGVIQDFTDKVHLVPFGEYLPLPVIFQYLEGLIAESGAFLPGPAHKTMSLPDTAERLGLFICFESVFPEISRTLVQLGASLLITITNDAWFGDSAAPYQHFSMVAARAVETGRPVVRAANTGISGLIAPSGRIVQTTGLFTSTAFTVPVRPRTATTFYVRHGDLLLILCGLLTAGYALWRVASKLLGRTSPD